MTVADLARLQQTALACIAGGDHAQALAYAQQLTRGFPSDADNWKLLGVAQQHLNQLHDGLASLERAAALAPGNANALCLYADALLRLEKHNEAFQCYQKALRCQPGNVGAARQVAHLLALSHRLEEAAAVLQESIALAPQVVELRVDAVSVALRLGALREARKSASEALVLAPGTASVIHAVGLVQMRAGDLPAALASFREELTLLPAPADAVRVAASSSLAPFDYRAAEALMWKTVAQLAQAGVHAFPSSGTLLGLVRDGHLLPFDKDTDLGLPFDEMEAGCACMLANGWVEHEHSSGLINPRAFRHLESGLMMDLCAFRVEPGTGTMQGGLWMDNVPWAWNRVTDLPPLTVRRVLRPEGHVWLLTDPEAWLTSWYGDWRTPEPDFDTVIAACNQRGFALLTQCYALLRLADQLKNGNLRKARTTCRIWLRHFPDDPQFSPLALRLDAALD